MNKQELCKIYKLLPIAPILLILFGLVLLGLVDRADSMTPEFKMIALLLASVWVLLGLIWWQMVIEFRKLEDKIAATTTATRTE